MWGGGLCDLDKVGEVGFWGGVGAGCGVERGVFERSATNECGMWRERRWRVEKGGYEEREKDSCGN